MNAPASGSPRPEIIVIGGGLVGSAIAYGLQSVGKQTLMLDQGDVAFRAARGNFGLVWVQSKGVDCPPYAQWTWRSAEDWAGLNEDLTNLTNLDLSYRRPGGIQICLNDAEMHAKAASMDRLATHAQHIDYRMLDRKALGNLLPGLAPDVAGGCLCSGDGHVNPLALLRALHAGFRSLGGEIRTGHEVSGIEHTAGTFQIKASDAVFEAERVVIAAGLGTPKLAEMTGLKISVRPQRGQNIITERMQRFLPMPMSGIRQTDEGSVQIGETKEEVGFDDATTTSGLSAMAERAVRIFPHLGRARMIRSWGALRVMSPDGAPIYAQSRTVPGAFAAVCHSGVTLAAAHARILAPAIAEGTLPPDVMELGPERFANA